MWAKTTKTMIKAKEFKEFVRNSFTADFMIKKYINFGQK